MTSPQQICHGLFHPPKHGLQGADAIAHIIDAQQNTGDGLAQQSGLALDGVLAQGPYS